MALRRPCSVVVFLRTVLIRPGGWKSLYICFLFLFVFLQVEIKGIQVAVVVQSHNRGHQPRCTTTDSLICSILFELDWYRRKRKYRKHLLQIMCDVLLLQREKTAVLVWGLTLQSFRSGVPLLQLHCQLNGHWLQLGGRGVVFLVVHLALGLFLAFAYKEYTKIYRN